jgi:two-component system OmpR family sensor kinase
MNLTRRLGSGRGRLSLRSRLLAGLITVTALFLIIMGVVTTVVLGNSEQGQFNSDLALTGRLKLSELSSLPGGYAVAYYNTNTRSVQVLSSPPTPALRELTAFLDKLVVTRRGWTAFRDQHPAGALFPIAQPDPALTAVWRPVTPTEAQRSEGTLLPGTSILVIARPDSAVGSEVRGLVAAELITGAILLALLAVGGRWLISRGLAPIDRMASTADMITSRGDLTARMPDPGDHAEAGRLAGAINTMLDRIQQAFRARYESEQKVRQFAADASHELRTPLTTIRGYAELYRQGALGEDRLPNAMRRIEQEADRMSSLVAELLELARLDRDSSLDLTETDLSALVADAVADAQAVEPRRPVGARTPHSLVVVADEPRIRQVLANLLGNVREHTAPDTPVSVRLSEAGQGALLEVTDSGQGMNTEAAARAFDRFYRGGHNGKDPHGSGLGLAIVQAIAAAHGGHAMLKSAAGVGTSVQVWIPFHPPAQAAERTQPPGTTYN